MALIPVEKDKMVAMGFDNNRCWFILLLGIYITASIFLLVPSPEEEAIFLAPDQSYYYELEYNSNYLNIKTNFEITTYFFENSISVVAGDPYQPIYNISEAFHSIDQSFTIYEFDSLFIVIRNVGIDDASVKLIEEHPGIIQDVENYFLISGACIVGIFVISSIIKKQFLRAKRKKQKHERQASRNLKKIDQS